MAQGSVQVTYKPTEEARIPDALIEGTALLMDLRRRGVVDAAGRRLRIRRQGGYCALDVFLLLLLFFTTGASRGVRKFWEILGRCVRQVASVAGRRCLPSPASLSRALDSVEVELVRKESMWLATTMGPPEPGDLPPVGATRFAAYGTTWLAGYGTTALAGYGTR